MLMLGTLLVIAGLVHWYNGRLLDEFLHSPDCSDKIESNPNFSPCTNKTLRLTNRQIVDSKNSTSWYFDFIDESGESYTSISVPRELYGLIRLGELTEGKVWHGYVVSLVVDGNRYMTAFHPGYSDPTLQFLFKLSVVLCAIAVVHSTYRWLKFRTSP
ncbi:MAG: hypothetical protein EXQ56_01445 [Acidobacteria bacterium]|nr:hypothetical protein [Acidobacteriota bacterium]